MQKYTMEQALNKLEDFREVVESVLESASDESEIAIIDKREAVRHITENLIAYGFGRFTDGVDEEEN